MQPYKRVALIGVDGAGSFFQKTDTPALDQIFENASVAYDVTTSYPSISAECWGSMLIGVTPQVHRLTNAVVQSRPYDTASIFPTLFRVIRENDPDCALASFCNWNAINAGIIEEHLHVTKGTGSDKEVTDQICSYLADHDPKLLFVQFDEVDSAGHRNNYGSPEHLHQITVTDSYIQRIYQAYADRGFLEDTLFIVTADHGGLDYRHGGNSDAEMKVMFAVKGVTVEKNGAAVDMQIRDTAAIALYALGYEQPKSWTGTIPSGIFEGVTAIKRPVYEIAYAFPHRTRESLPTPATGLPESIRSRALAYLPFDSTTSSAVGNPMVEEGGKLYFVDGYYDRGIRLDDGYVALSEISIGSTDFALSFFLKLQDAFTEVESIILSNKDYTKKTNKGFALTLTAGRLICNIGDGEHLMDTSFPLPLDGIGGWVHVFFVLDRENGTISLTYDFGEADARKLADYLKDAAFDHISGIVIGQDKTRTYPHPLPAVIDELLIIKGKQCDDDIPILSKYYDFVKA